MTSHDPARHRFSGRPRQIVLGAVGLAALIAIAVFTVGATQAGQPGAKAAAPSARAFSLKRLGHSGSKVSLAALAGRPVIVNFFASWCAPCQRETPLLARFYAAHHGQVAVIGIDANDQANAALKFVRKERVTYPVGVDPFPARTATSYGVLALPQTFFLNAQHRIVRHVVGAVTARELAAWAAASGHRADSAG